MNDRKSSRPTPRAPLGDQLRVVGSSLLFLVLAILRRLLGQRRRPGWSLQLEAVIAAYRGSWSVMPALGIVRWRNVGEVLSPLQTDGLEPRFVRIGSGASEIEGVWL
ncbi:MAG TPA: hypothetical protein VJU61_24395, partial [Polyangiaceae bacterium]|nr:hypothetical protein [Polyangiaceae bacterium]